MTKDEALRMALEALHGFIPYLPLDDEAQCGRYDQAITAIKEALAQPEQEPVAWITKTGSVWKTKWDDSDIPLYTTPPQRKPLTDEQRRETINRAWNDYLRWEGNDSFGWYLSQAIEAAHGIKGDA